MYLTLAQTAKELDRTERQVRYLVKTGVLTPVNKDTFKRDGGYRFSRDVVERIKVKLKPKGISLRKAAEIVGVTPQYLNSFALKGEIKSQIVLIGNKKERRFKKSDCENFRSKIRKKTHKSIAEYGDKLCLYNYLRLFELICFKGEKARVVKTDPITFLKADGTLDHPDAKSDIPLSSKWEEKTYKTKKGFVTFRLPIPRNAEHTTYDILYTIIGGLGPKNIQVFERDDGDYFIRCRQGKIQLQQQYIDMLNRYIVDGEIYQINENEISLQSSIVSQYIHLPKELHEKIEELAIKRQVSTEEQIIEVVSRGLSSFHNNQE